MPLKIHHENWQWLTRSRKNSTTDCSSCAPTTGHWVRREACPGCCAWPDWAARWRSEDYCRRAAGRDRCSRWRRACCSSTHRKEREREKSHNPYWFIVVWREKIVKPIFRKLPRKKRAKNGTKKRRQNKEAPSLETWLFPPLCVLLLLLCVRLAMNERVCDISNRYFITKRKREREREGEGEGEREGGAFLVCFFLNERGWWSSRWTFSSPVNECIAQKYKRVKKMHHEWAVWNGFGKGMKPRHHRFDDRRSSCSTVINNIHGRTVWRCWITSCMPHPPPPLTSNYSTFLSTAQTETFLLGILTLKPFESCFCEWIDRKFCNDAFWISERKLATKFSGSVAVKLKASEKFHVDPATQVHSIPKRVFFWSTGGFVDKKLNRLNRNTFEWLHFWVKCPKNVFFFTFGRATSNCGAQMSLLWDENPWRKNVTVFGFGDGQKLVQP